MAYEEGERDFVVSTDFELQRSFKMHNLTPGIKFLQHNFEIENKDGNKDTITSTLCEYGTPIGSGGYTAMARLVGIPCAVGKSSSVATIAIRMVLQKAEVLFSSTSPSLTALHVEQILNPQHSSSKKRG